MNKDRVILGNGENCIFSSDIKKTGLNNNVIVLGGSGTGKTCSIIEPRLLETYSKSLIVTCTKRRIVKKYSSLFRNRGYKVLDLNFVHPEDGNVGFDPLNFIDSFQSITFQSKSIVYANPQKVLSTADPYFDETATSLLNAEISYILMTKEHPTFDDVIQFHNGLRIEDKGGVISTNYDYLFEQLENRDPSCFAVTCFKSFKQLPIKTASCVFSSLNTTMDSIFTPEVRELFKKDQTLDFEELDRKSVV